MPTAPVNTLGLCIGSSSLTSVVLSSDGTVVDSGSVPHDGAPREALQQFFDHRPLSQFEKIAVTGRRLRHMLNAPTIAEPEATEYAYRALAPEPGHHAPFVVSAGGETFMAYRVGSDGEILEVRTGNKCASGTGEFFTQQLGRMRMSVAEGARTSAVADPYPVSGRCSVFCKSDCTHALNKGVPRDRVAAGLSRMLAGKIVELVCADEPDSIMIVGGCSRNEGMLAYLRESIPHVIVPEHAAVFEAYGAALWARRRGPAFTGTWETLFAQQQGTFTFHPPLVDAQDMVTFETATPGSPHPGDRAVLGLDVGSTTTKASLVRESDRAVLARVYLRTNGDPVEAARACYAGVLAELAGVPVSVIGLGVTGSGRRIAGLHALTPAVVNEIVAHACAAAHFNTHVDTIFEIGGQDAKYTYLTNGVASDYAMNEACSAGTGSFLEEAAFESLSVPLEEIAELAMGSRRPPNFSDQCSAFINSDVKSAIQQGITVGDIAAGLVYSVCANYTNRVRGNRPVGNTVFMQGGVCYNRAVPIAMAALTGRSIVVPPDPGMMGAFGVALDTLNKLSLGILEEAGYNLVELSEREVEYRSSFVCPGGAERCDRGCDISRLVVNGRVYPFGGACDKYAGIGAERGTAEARTRDLAALREHLVFEKYTAEYPADGPPADAPSVGVSRSLLTHTLFPFYYHLFTRLGYRVVSNEEIAPEGVGRKGSAFCHPVELAHGSLAGLLKRRPDIVFLPHVRSVAVGDGAKESTTCPFVQGESYYLRSAFPELENYTVLAPVLDFAADEAAQLKTWQRELAGLGRSRSEIRDAFRSAAAVQRELEEEMRAIGRDALRELEEHPDEIGIVLFGRPYNAFAGAANMGIPHKFASRGYRVIPVDFLPHAQDRSNDSMYWAMGRIILNGAAVVAEHDQLFGAYVTNFSCGPDSFLLGYFREAMGRKPSLTLELDSHTADAGIDTRIEAFIDVVASYRALAPDRSVTRGSFTPARSETVNGTFFVVDSAGRRARMTDPGVKLLIPSMGHFGSELFAATFRRVGYDAAVVDLPTERELAAGRRATSNKECLPLQITVGSLLEYLEHRGSTDELLVYFMPEVSGPCRFGQYNVFMRKLIRDRAIPNVTFLSITADNAYAGLKTADMLRIWQSIVISDVMDDIENAILALAVDREAALAVHARARDALVHSLEHHAWSEVKRTLRRVAGELSAIPTTVPYERAPKVGLLGEIYVRRDKLARGRIEERLADRGVVVKVAPVAEWIYYTDYVVRRNLKQDSDWKTRMGTVVKEKLKRGIEQTVKRILADSGLYEYREIDVNRFIKASSPLMSPELTGEAGLTIGGAITEIADEVAGVISIGPFGCMPSRIANAVTGRRINHAKALTACHTSSVQRVMERFPHLPFLPIEVDGNPFTQGIEANLESFCLRVERVHAEITGGV